MKLALFFTLGVSLKTWDEVGILEREIKPYNKMAGFFDEIYFFTYGGKEDLAYRKYLADNIKIFPKKLNLPNKIYSFLLPFLCGRKLREIDILKTNQMPGSWAATLAKKIYRKRLVVRTGYQWSLHAFYAGPVKKFFISVLEKWAYKKADDIIATSREARDYITDRYKINPDKISIISNYIDTELFRPVDAEKIPRSLCFVGRLERQKNLLNLFRALVGLNIKLIIFGAGSRLEELKNFARENDLDVDFKGNIANKALPSEISKCQIFILPSLYEGNPKVLLEAMAVGLPVIGTKVRGIQNIIEHEATGLLVETSPESIREATLKVLSDQELRRKMGREARKYAVENAGLDRIIKKELSLYEKITP